MLHRASLPFAFLFLAAAGAVHGQHGTPPPVDPAAVLSTLRDLRTRQTTVVTREKANVLAAINAAIADPAKAYEQAVAAVEFQNGSGDDGSRLIEWRKKQGALLRNRDFTNGVRLQLIYLALTWQHQMGTKPSALLNPLVDYTSQVAAAGDTLAAFDSLHKTVGESVFATYFEITPFLAALTGWSLAPFDIEGIFQKTILPEMRAEKDPRLLAYWDSRIQGEGARADASKNPLVLNKFKAIHLPALLWRRAADELILDHRNQAITDMLALVKAHPDHPEFQNWAGQLEELVSAQTTPAAAPAATP